MTAIKMKNTLIFSLLALILGGITGAAIWLFFKVMNTCLDFFWTFLPERVGFSLYPVLICVLGGLLIGLWQRRYGEYPQELNEVMAEVKTKGGVAYNNLHIIAVAALLPLILTSAITSLSSWGYSP